MMLLGSVLAVLLAILNRGRLRALLTGKCQHGVPRGSCRVCELRRVLAALTGPR